MPVVFAAMAPHGFSLTPAMHDTAEGGTATRDAMEELGRRCRAAAPDIIAIATPHGFRVDGSICVSDAARGAGAIRWAGRTLEQSVPFDHDFAVRLAETARAAGAPVALGAYGGGSWSSSVLPLDWGVITPLWFLAYPQNMTGAGDVLADPPATDGPAAVVICPARNLAAPDLIAFGHALVDAAEADGRRIAYIASCDWSHRHAASGPYGYSEVAKPADARIVAAVQGNDLGALASVTPHEIADAAMDGIPQALILAGVVERTGFAVDLLSYEAPTYYGMLVASYA